jgi:hypothetical protein
LYTTTRKWKKMEGKRNLNARPTKNLSSQLWKESSRIGDLSISVCFDGWKERGKEGKHDN